MTSTDLSARLKYLRQRQGLSQEALSELASLNLRTIQRIENGASAARGDTLRRLALALNCPVEELTGVQPAASAGMREDRPYLVLLNLSALSFLFFPFLLGIVTPLLFWVIKKDRVAGLNQTATRLINFQIIWAIAFVIAFATYGYMVLLYLINFWVIVFNTVVIALGKQVMYPFFSIEGLKRMFNKLKRSGA